MSIAKLAIPSLLAISIILLITSLSCNYKNNDVVDATDVVEQYQNAMENYNYESPSASEDAILKYVANADLKGVSDNEQYIFNILSKNDTESLKGKSTVKFLSQVSANEFQLNGTIYVNTPSNSTNKYSVRGFFQKYTVEKQKNGSFLITNVVPITVPSPR